MEGAAVTLLRSIRATGFCQEWTHDTRVDMTYVALWATQCWAGAEWTRAGTRQRGVRS